MKLGKNATLIGGAIFVLAASIFVETIEKGSVPQDVANSLELKPVLFASRVVAVANTLAPQAGDDVVFESMAGMLAEQAGKPFHRPSDYIEAAATAASMNARYLVPLFIGGQAATDEGAAVMLRWAVDPEFKPGPAELNRLRALKADQAYVTMAVCAVMAGSGRVVPETALMAENALLVEYACLLIVAALVALFIWGIVSLFKWRRRQFAEVMRERQPVEIGTIRAPFEVYIWFMALFLATNLLLPQILDRYVITPAQQTLVAYVIIATGGLIIAVMFGRTGAEQDWKKVLGLTSTPGGAVPVKGVASLVGGLRGYAMILPLVLVANALTGLLGGTDPDAQGQTEMLVLAMSSKSDRIIVVLSAVVLSPLFEECLFRGFFFRRLRTVMTPYGAAMVSGFVFAAAHMSATGFLQIWVIGFALALTYEQTGRLRSSIIAHGLWNLGTMATLIIMYG